MKKPSRLLYFEIAKLVGSGLCSCCRYSRSNGDSVCEGEGEMWCEHPLSERIIEEGDQEILCAIQGGDRDCWGFSPMFSVQVWADIVGVILENSWDKWQYFKSKTGRYHVQTIDKEVVLEY